MTAATPPDLNTKMTERARIVWSLGDFARAGAEQVIVAEFLGDGVTGLTVQVLSTGMCGMSPAARVEFNRTYVGPPEKSRRPVRSAHRTAGTRWWPS